METIFVSLIAIVMLLLSTFFIVSTSMDSAENISQSLKYMDAQTSNRQLTAIDSVFVGLQDTTVVISVANIGQQNLSDFPLWDVLVQKQDGAITRLAYTSSSPAGEQWNISRIDMLNGAPEIFDPGILNPDEKAILHLNLNQPLQPGEIIRVTVVTGNGVTSQCLAG